MADSSKRAKTNPEGEGRDFGLRGLRMAGRLTWGKGEGI